MGRDVARPALPATVPLLSKQQLVELVYRLDAEAELLSYVNARLTAKLAEASRVVGKP